VTHDQQEALELGHRVAVMNRGAVLQVGSAEEVYDRPANLFVARFIGSPPMNLVAGVVRRTPQGVCFDGGGIRATALWEAHVGRSVVLGVRPEDVLLLPIGSASRSVVGSATVRTVQRCGAVEVVRVDVAGAAKNQEDCSSELTVSVRSSSERTVAVGQPVELAFAAGRPTLFDAATGVNLG